MNILLFVTKLDELGQMTHWKLTHSRLLRSERLALPAAACNIAYLSLSAPTACKAARADLALLRTQLAPNVQVTRVVSGRTGTNENVSVGPKYENWVDEKSVVAQLWPQNTRYKSGSKHDAALRAAQLVYK